MQLGVFVVFPAVLVAGFLVWVWVFVFHLFSGGFILFIYFWLRWVVVVVRGLFSSCSEWGQPFTVACGLLTGVASLVVGTDRRAFGLQ